MASPLAGDRGDSHYWDHDNDNTAAVVTLSAPGSELVWRIIEIFYGYDTTPASATTLQIQLDGSQDVKKIPVTGAGANKLTPIGMFGQKNSDVVITLPAGGASVNGYLDVQAVKVPQA